MIRSRTRLPDLSLHSNGSSRRVRCAILLPPSAVVLSSPKFLFLYATLPFHHILFLSLPLPPPLNLSLSPLSLSSSSTPLRHFQLHYFLYSFFTSSFLRVSTLFSSKSISLLVCCFELWSRIVQFRLFVYFYYILFSTLPRSAGMINLHTFLSRTCN